MTRQTFIAILLIAVGVPMSARQSPAAEPLSPLGPFIGKWSGSSEGQPGKGIAEREYRPALGGRVVQLTNRVVYPQQPANPKGETHEDIGIFSFDRSAKRLRFRQFHGEGFVVHYLQRPASDDGVLVFESEAIENIPPGYRSRESFKMIGPDEFEEVFELAEPGKEFAVYSRTRLRRIY